MKTKILKFFWGAIVLLGMIPAALQAQSLSWTNSLGGSWTNAGSWSPNAAPSNNPAISIVNAGSKTVTIDAATPAGNLTITNLTITSAASASNILYLSGNVTPLTVLGTVTLDGAGASAIAVDGGQLATSSTVYMNGGSVTVSNGGWLSSGVVNLGWGAPGTLTFAGGSNVFSGALNFAASASGTGTVLMTGGQLTTSAASLGNASGGVGIMTVSNGTWGGSATVGLVGGSVGTLNLAGGTNLLSSLVIAQAGATGTVSMTGGQLVTTNGTVTMGNGAKALSTMTVSGGQWLASGLNMGGGAAGSVGTLNIGGGTNLFSSSFFVGGISGGTGTVSMTGGQLVTTNSTAVFGNSGAGAYGNMTVSGGVWLGQNLQLGRWTGSKGVLTITGGSNVFSGSVVSGENSANGLNSTGTVAMSGGYLSVGVGGGVYLGTNSISKGIGSFLLSSGGVLEANLLVSGFNGSGVFTNQAGGVLQFTTAAPTLVTNTVGSIVVSNAVISYRNVAAADITNAQVSNITFQGNNTFRLNNSTNVSVASYTFDTNGGPYQSLQLMGAAPTWQGTVLTIGAGGALLVTNTPSARVGGLLTNLGTISVMNGSVVYGGNVVNLGAYVSDPSTNAINGDFTVGTNGTVTAAAGDIYALGGNFVMQSTNRAFNMSLAQVVFATNGYGLATTTASHIFNLTNSGAVDMGSNWLNVAQLATNFSIGTLSIALSNHVTVTGAKSGSLTNALYVGWLDLSAWNTNAATLSATLSNALTLADINLYYDASDTRNAYLQDASYNIWGGGLLIPIPEPNALTLTLAAGALSMFILRWKGRRV